MEDDQDDEDIVIDATEDEIKTIRLKEGKKVELQFSMDDELKRSMETYMGKLMAEMTKRLDTLEKSKQREDEEKILSNTTQDLQDPVLKDKKEANEETEDSNSNSSSDEDDNEALEASRLECTKLRKEVEKEKSKNVMASHLLEKWETEKKDLTKAIKDKERDYSRACDETDKNMQEIKSLKKEIKVLKATANQSLKLTEEKVIGYEKRIRDLEGELDDKNERLRAVELYNARMITKNNDLEKSNKKIRPQKENCRRMLKETT